MSAIEDLKAVLCDPEGNVSIQGSDEDKKTIQTSLAAMITNKLDHDIIILAALNATLECVNAEPEDATILIPSVIKLVEKAKEVLEE